MQIELFQPHTTQKEVLKSLLNNDIFLTLAVIGRQWGKSCLGENIAIYWALNNPKAIIYWISPTDGQAQKIYKEIIDAIYESGAIKTKTGSKGDISITFLNGSQIIFKSAVSEDSLRGPSVDYMIIDEGAFIKKETLEQILLPMLAVRGKKLYIATTPKGKNWVYEYFLMAQTKKNWQAFRYSTLDSPLANKDMLQMFKETLSEGLYQQEILAEFVDSMSVFKNIEQVLVLPSLQSPIPNENYYAGIDIGLITDSSVLSIIDSNGNLVKYYSWTNITAPVLIEEIKSINSKWKFKRIYIENNNQGLPIYQTLKLTENNVEQFNTNTKTKQEIINRLIFLFNTIGIKCVNDNNLRIELEAFIFKIGNTGHIRFTADSSFHDDIIMATAIALECFEKKKGGGVDFSISFINF